MLLRPRYRGFTIVELLVAATITALLVVLLGTMFGSLTKTTSHANQRIDAFRDARAALQMMERDLTGLVRTHWKPDPFASPAPTASPQPLTRPAAYLAIKNIYDPASANQEIYALMSTKNSGPGNVCSVGYYCSWDGKSYTLHRFFRASDQTYSTLALPPPTPPPSPAPSVTPPQPYISDSNIYRPNPASSPTPTDDVLAQYVWNLKVTAYDATGNALPYGLVCDGSAIDPISPVGTAQPVIVEISFRAMSPEAARTVMSVTNDPIDWMDSTRSRYRLLIAPHTYEFRTRITL